MANLTFQWYKAHRRARFSGNPLILIEITTRGNGGGILVVTGTIVMVQARFYMKEERALWAAVFLHVEQAGNVLISVFKVSLVE